MVIILAKSMKVTNERSLWPSSSRNVSCVYTYKPKIVCLNLFIAVFFV